MPTQKETTSKRSLKKLRKWSRSCLEAMADPKKSLYQQVLLMNFNKYELRPHLDPIDHFNLVKKINDNYGSSVLEKYFVDIENINYPLRAKMVEDLTKELECLDKKLFQTVHRYYSSATLRAVFTDERTAFPLKSLQRTLLQGLLKKQRKKDKKLIESIFDAKLDTSGIGFFRFKTPNHIKKLRAEIDRDTIEYPLTEELRKALFEIVYDACDRSDNLFSLRSYDTDELYRNLQRSLPG